MNENIKSNYYAVIPAIVRYDKDLTDKAKLLYGEITCLCNKEGYCFATNNYFSNLYNCTPRAIQFTLSKLQEKGYIKIIVENNYQRKIYLTDALRYEKIFTPPHENNFIGGYEKNFTNNNIKYNIDDLFHLIINNSNEIPEEFLAIIDRLEFNYKPYMLQYMKEDKINMVKNVIYVLYDLYNSNFQFLLQNVSREYLINLYFLAVDNKPDTLLNYYKKSIINSSTNYKKI